MFGFDNQQIGGAAGVQAHAHFGGGKGQAAGAGKGLGAAVGGVQHGREGDVEVEAAHAQHDNARGKPIGLFGEYVGAGLAEIVAHGGNQRGGGADLRQQRFADERGLFACGQRVAAQIGAVAVAVYN